ncbi:MAG: anti-sigma factor [Chloroflexi bacterium]|nr:anti-sigma factor [Chloroflexota bacterium]
MTHSEAIDRAAAYVLGALERTEEAAVREHLATCAEPHAEFEALSGVVPALLELADLELVEPPAALGGRIMAAAAADLAANPRAGAVTPSAAASRPTPSAAWPTPSIPTAPSAPTAFPSAAGRAARSERNRTGRFDWALRIAAVIAIVAVGAWGLSLQGQLQGAHDQLEAARHFDTAIASVIGAAGQPDAKTVILKPAEGATANGIAAIASDGSVVLAMRDLTPTSGSQVYEAWVIVGEAAPVPVGGFSVDSDRTAGFTTRPAEAPPGAVIALSLEPSEGSTVPVGPIVSTGIALAPASQNG